jgi:hypothetical protein
MPDPIFMQMYLYHDNWPHLNGILHESLPSVCMSVCFPPFIAKKRLDKNIIAATNTHATIEELLDGVFSMQSVSYQRKAGEYFFL